MRVIHLLPILAALLLAPVVSLQAEEKPPAGVQPTNPAERSVAVRAMLISASAEKGPSDRRLAAIEGNLRSSLRFESFKFIGEGSAKIDLPGSSEITLPQGQKVVVEAAYYGEGVVWLRVIWRDGGRQFMNVVYGRWQRGRPIVIGGLTKGGENLAIVVTPR